jgi:hypothetical protein
MRLSRGSVTPITTRAMASPAPMVASADWDKMMVSAKLLRTGKQINYLPEVASIGRSSWHNYRRATGNRNQPW